MNDSSSGVLTAAPLSLPNHLQLPDRDGAVVNNFKEHPQSALLTGCLLPRLRQIQPDGQFAIGEDCGIYWRHFRQEPLRGCKAPDWFCVLGVPATLAGEIRRSYVLWDEGVPPLLVIEYVSGDGTEEHDTTPQTGKFWVYERAIRAPVYVILDGFRGTLEVYRANPWTYEQAEPNERGRYRIDPLGIELGLWEGEYHNQTGWWVRAWDASTGELMPTPEEVAEREHLRAETERLRAETARLRAETAEELLDDIREMLQEETERAEAERRRAEESQRYIQALLEQMRQAGIAPPPPNP